MKRLKLSLIIGLSLSLSILSCSAFDNIASKNIDNKTVDNKNSSYVIDVGHGKKGADISVKIDFKNINPNFKTKASSNGIVNKTVTDIKSLKFYIIKKTGTGITTTDPYDDATHTDPVSDIVVGQTNASKIVIDNPINVSGQISVTLKDVPFSTSSFGSGGYFYLGVRAYDTSGATGTELIKSNNDGSVIWTGTTAGINNKFAISNGNTSSKPGISNIQIKDTDYSISDTTPIGITMYLDDAVGASIDTTINPTDGLAVAPISVSSLTGFIETIGGTGFTGNTGNGLSATKATLKSPNNIKVDSMGNIYFADTGNNVIKKIDTTGKITIVAGDGTICPDPTTACGDGGQATSSNLTTPRSVYIDPMDENIIYIADTGNNKIRKVDLTTRIISTIAGTGNSGPYNNGVNATNTNLSSPSDIVRDSTPNNIYFSDSVNNRIRKIDTSGNINTVVGNGTSCTSGACGDSSSNGTAGSATLNNPIGLAVDNDDILIADSGSNSIRIFHTNGNYIKTINDSSRVSGYSPNATLVNNARFNNPTFISYDKKIGRLYVSDTGNNVIRILNKYNDNTIQTLAGDNTTTCPAPINNCGDRGVSTLANLNNPRGVFVDNSGLVYISDTNDNRIRKVY